MIFAFVGWVAKATLGIIVLAVVIGFIIHIGQNPNSSGGAVEDFISGVVDVVKGWFAFGQEIAD